MNEISFRFFRLLLDFLDQIRKLIDQDLVRSEEVKASITVRHIVLLCCSSAREKQIPDIVRCYRRLVLFFLVNIHQIHSIFSFGY